MNANFDIKDGLEEFQSDKVRNEAEQHFMRNPHLFRIVDRKVVKVHNIVLIGRRVSQEGHPYDFEAGVADIEAEVQGEPAIPCTVRWHDDGEGRVVEFSDLAGH